MCRWSNPRTILYRYIQTEPGALSLENGLKLGEFLPEAFRKLGKMDKKMERYATTAQDILWKYYDYERLSKEVCKNDMNHKYE